MWKSDEPLREGWDLVEIAIDLGTANCLVCVRGKGIVLREPSVVAINRDTNQILAIGQEAKRMVGKTPADIIATRPLRDGVIADYDVTQAMLHHFITRVSGRARFMKPRVMICIPTGATGAERRAVIEAAKEAGAGQVELIDEAMAAAIGLGLEIEKPGGHMVVDIGGGTSDIAILSLGGIAGSSSVRSAGDRMDAAIQNEVRRLYGLAIGERTAEEIKMTVGSVHPKGRPGEYDLRGRDVVTGLPRNYPIHAHEIQGALNEPTQLIMDAIRSALETTPAELVGDVAERGIWFTGGGSLLHGLLELAADEMGVPTHLAEDPLTTVAIGTQRALETHFEGGHIMPMKKVL